MMARKLKIPPEEPDNLPIDWAIITPSYTPDFGRCKLLCQSIDAFVSGDWHHYIIVSSDDLALFATLAGPKRSIVAKETMVPKGLMHLPRFSRLANSLVRFVSFSLWFSWATGFMVGWQVQQIIKIEMARRVKETGILCCDSDVFFVRPFKLKSLVRDGRLRFYRGRELSNEKGVFAEKEQSYPRFILSSAKLLGLKGNPFPSPWYVDQLIVWHRPTVEAMCNHIARITGEDWKRAAARWYNLSEYSLYGLFVDRIMANNRHLETTSVKLCKTIWYKATMNEAKFTEFCTDLDATEVAVCVQSFAGFVVTRLEAQFELALMRQKRMARRSL